MQFPEGLENTPFKEIYDSIKLKGKLLSQNMVYKIFLWKKYFFLKVVRDLHAVSDYKNRRWIFGKI